VRSISLDNEVVEARFTAVIVEGFDPCNLAQSDLLLLLGPVGVDTQRVSRYEEITVLPNVFLLLHASTPLADEALLPNAVGGLSPWLGRCALALVCIATSK
jgi:hypothetical protein